MWRGRAGTGAPILSDFARNWAYDARWGPMMGHQPFAGEQMGFFVSSGNARGEAGVTARRERSNVVIIVVAAWRQRVVPVLAASGPPEEPLAPASCSIQLVPIAGC